MRNSTIVGFIGLGSIGMPIAKSLEKNLPSYYIRPSIRSYCRNEITRGYNTSLIPGSGSS
jgi:3-hydroxyisobutyrate dehydrogenase-like beta-hydroxyacid dehydrogenase